MTSKRDFDLAQDRLDMDNCFWGSNAMMRGEESATRMVKESEEELRTVAGRIISEGITGFVPRSKTVSMVDLKQGLVNLKLWEVRGYSEYVWNGTDHVPRYAELVERIKPLSDEEADREIQLYKSY